MPAISLFDCLLVPRSEFSWEWGVLWLLSGTSLVKENGSVSQRGTTPPHTHTVWSLHPHTHTHCAGV